jgi:quinolinate synthase
MNLWDYANLSEGELIERIGVAKRDSGAVILAHNYQRLEIQKIADFCGDSLELARKVGELEAETIVFCGVMFMAETAKILNPKSRVLIPDPQAGCPLAAYGSADDITAMKAKYPDYAVVTYINSSAEAKAVSDVICTSANAPKVVASIPENRGIIFVPDKNLCYFVKKSVKRDNIVCWNGNCYIHDRFTATDVEHARASYPDAMLIVHPECAPDVQDRADLIFSTSRMAKWVDENAGKSVVLGTETGMIEKIKSINPMAKVYPLKKDAICSNMKLNTLSKVCRALEEGVFEVAVPTEIAKRAKLSIDRMLEIR